MRIISFDNVSFSYNDETRALDGVSLDIEAGSFVCLVGSNGSGKSTLARQVNALLVPDEGSVEVFGIDTRDHERTYEIRRRVGMVFQNPDDQIVASLVADDVAFGPSNLGVPIDDLTERVSNALGRVGLEGFERHETAALSGGQKQKVAIAGALAMNPQVLVLDEPTSMLDPRGRAELMRLCSELNTAGLTIVLITHFMEEAALADRIVVLDSGRIALDGTPNEVLTQIERLEELRLDAPPVAQLCRELGAPLMIREDELVTWWRTTGKTLHHAPLGKPARTPRHAPREQVAQRIENVSYRYRKDDPWAIENVSLEVTQGEVLGIAGPTGSGKSTLIQLMGGLLKPAIGNVSQLRRSEIGIVFQYPERQLFAATVFDDVSFGPLNLGVAADEIDARVAEALQLVHLDAALRDMSPFALSGGEQRRIAIAGVLAMRPRLLILDEPTAGLDPFARHALLDLIEELHDKRDMTITIVSHDMDDLARLCDRIVILNEGRIEQAGTPDEVFADEAALHDIGLAIPTKLHLRRLLDAV